MSPPQTYRHIFLPDFSESVKMKKKNCQKIYWAVRTPPLYFDKMSKKKKEISKQTLWIWLIKKHVLTRNKKKATWYIKSISVAKQIFLHFFSFKKWPPWQFYLDHCDTYIISNKSLPLLSQLLWIFLSFSSSKTHLKKKKNQNPLNYIP